MEIAIPQGTFLDKENQARRCPCILLLDTSYSMNDDPLGGQQRPIDLLNSALPAFQEALMSDPTARQAVELAIITFGGSPITIQDWTDVEHLQIPTLSPSGSTPLGPAIMMAINLIDARRTVYRQNSIASYVPWLFILTDGQPDDSGLQEAVRRVQAMQQVAPGSKSPKLIAYACSTDTRPDVMGRLKAITPRAFELRGMAFRELFQWLSASLKTVSKAAPGAGMELPTPPSQMTLSQALTVNP
jgi:uncharacterized protein YegL